MRLPRCSMTSLRLVLFATLAAIPRVQHGQQTADFSGVDAFWNVTGSLLRDVEPGDSAWDALFGTPGYAALETREHRRNAITNAMRAAYMPSMLAKRNSILSTTGWTARVIRHIQSLPADRARLDSFRSKIERLNVAGAAAARTQSLLPAGTVQRYGTPNVAFIFFLPDGRGYPTLIVADLAHVMSESDPVPFFAHEFSHFYWNKLSRAQAASDSSRDTPGGDALRGLLTKIAEESIGDQFDKADAVTLDSSSLAGKYAARPDWLNYLLEYRSEFANADSQLAALDGFIQRMSDSTTMMPALADSASAGLPLEGRPLGMYIARAIRSQLGDARLASTVGNAVDYFLAYDEASHRRSCNCVEFSAKSMKLIRALQ